MKPPLPRAAAMLAGAAIVAGLAACAPSEPAGPTVSTLMTNMPGFAVSGDWNPVTSGYLNTFTLPVQAVYESFIELDTATFTWEPLLAESYAISDDARSMAITLRQDVDFTDGTHLDAETAKKSFDLALTGPTGDVLRDVYSTAIEVTGEYELLVTAAKSMNPSFLLWLGLLPIVSPTAIENSPEELSKTPVGTGPYVLEELVPEVSVTFVRNPDFRDPDEYPFDELQFTAFADGIAASNALKSGQLNAAQIDPSLAADIESNGFELAFGVGAHVSLGWWDSAGALLPALTDVRVRQAIAYALDREAIIENLEYGYGTLTTQAWGKGSPYYIEGADDTYPYDLERARSLMAEAGYEDGFALTIPTYSDTAKYEPVVQQALADIGITVTYKAFPNISAWAEAAYSHDYPLIIFTGGDLWNSVEHLVDEEAGVYEHIGELYDAIDFGTKEEGERAYKEIAQVVLDEALQIALSRPAEVWASIPEISVEPTIVNGYPMRLRSFQLAD